jgi:hypothetical protein
LTAFLTWPGIAARGFALSFDGPSLLQPLLLLTAAAGTALAAGVARGTGGVARRLSLVALSVLALAAAALAVPAIRGPIRDGFVRFLLRRDPWLAGIQEFQPLFDGSPPVPQLTYYFGSVGVLAPLLAAAGIAFAARSRRSTAAAFAWFLLCAAALTLLQVRFGRVLAPLLAVAAGLAIAWLASALARRLPGPAPTATVLAVLVAAGLVGADERLRGAFRVGASPISPAAEAALDLRAAPLDPSLPGVHSAWDLGHGLSILGCRPVLTNGFGSFLDHDAFAEAEGALGLTAGAYEAFLDRRKVGIVVAGPATFRVRPPGGRDWYEAGERGAVLDVASLRALPLSPLLIAGSALPAADVRHLEHLMVRFASTKVVGGLSFDLPLLWSYERVPGARLRGRTAPAVRVVASIPLRERGRPHAWKAFADADARGRWEMILPVPSALVTPTVTTGPRFELRAGAGPAVVISVPEAAVRGGSTIHVTTPIPFVAPRE